MSTKLHPGRTKISAILPNSMVDAVDRFAVERLPTEHRNRTVALMALLDYALGEYGLAASQPEAE